MFYDRSISEFEFQISKLLVGIFTAANGEIVFIGNVWEGMFFKISAVKRFWKKLY